MRVRHLTCFQLATQVYVCVYVCMCFFRILDFLSLGLSSETWTSHLKHHKLMTLRTESKYSILVGQALVTGGFGQMI